MNENKNKPDIFPLRALSVDTAPPELAGADSLEAGEWLYSQLDNDPSDEQRGWILRYAYSDGNPECSELYGEPNPAFAPALVDFVQKTKFMEELEVDTIDDALCRAALTILSEGVCGSLVDGIELSYFRQTINIDKLLSLAIGHMGWTDTVS